MRYVIIGGSAAAIGCIEGVRSVDKTGEIILITGETEWNYSRPLISYLLELHNILSLDKSGACQRTEISPSICCTQA